MIVKKIEISLALFILGLLFVPLAITIVNKAHPGMRLLKPLVTSNLYGVTLDEPRPALSKDSWLGGTYQAGYARWFSQRFAIRDAMIRLSNEIDYLVFHKSTMDHGNLTVGKEKQLYEMPYLKDYAGINPPMPIERLDAIVRQMADLQARLQKRNVPFLVLVSPSKASIYPQFIPDAFNRSPNAAPRNYDNAIRLLKKYDVHFIDGHEITEAALTKTDLPLYCQGGVHWNSLGASYTVDALTQMIGTLSKTSPPRMIRDGVTVNDVGQGLDTDLAQLLNVIWEPDHYPAPHPKLHFDHKEPSSHIVFVGGSFVRGIVGLLDQYHVYGSMDYYYYWREHWAFPHLKITPFHKEALDWDREIFGAKAVVLEINEEAFSTGQKNHYTTFLDDALQHLPK